MGHVLIENRNGLAVDAVTTRVSDYAERFKVLEMLDNVVELDRGRRITFGADEGYDTRDFVARICDRGATPHVAKPERPAFRD